MDFLKQLSIIICINFLGEIVSSLLYPFPIPGNVIGFCVFLIFLYYKIIKLKQIENVCISLISNMGFFFIPPAVSIINNIYLLENLWWKIILICSISSIITVISTAFIIQGLIKIFYK